MQTGYVEGVDSVDDSERVHLEGADRFAAYVLPELDVLGRVALSLTRSAPDAEDLVQETLLRAYRAIDRFDGRYPRAWLLTIMRNAQVNRVRRKRPELLRDPEDAVRTMSDTDGEGSTTEDRVMHGQFDSVVEVAFNELPLKFREVVELVDLNQLSYQEAADVLEVPVGTVMSRLHRGRKRIRDHLGDDHPAARTAATRDQRGREAKAGKAKEGRGKAGKGRARKAKAGDSAHTGSAHAEGRTEGRS